VSRAADRAVNHDDHVRLLRNGVPTGGAQTWADFGSGRGAFTLALRDLAGSEVEIWSVDRDASALRAQRDELARRFPGTALHTVTADFTETLTLPPLDGIVAANAIHFVRDQRALLARWRRYLKADGRLVVVEYEREQAISWVPFPLSFRRLMLLAEETGFADAVLLDAHPSRQSPHIYSAMLVQTLHGDGGR
jgi:ubiquinone/menaquinone biosynthesis C-methylase UbiE